MWVRVPSPVLKLNAVYPNGQEQYWKYCELNGLVGPTPMYGAMAGKSERFRECLESTSW